jgi:hypothetical protein
LEWVYEKAKLMAACRDNISGWIFELCSSQRNQGWSHLIPALASKDYFGKIFSALFSNKDIQD